MIEFSPLPWGEGGESSEPGEGFLPTEPRNVGIRVYLGLVLVNLCAAAASTIVRVYVPTREPHRR
jgi:hypothetical protein